MAKKRQKRRKQNIRNRKRRLKNQADYEIGSSSFTDCTDEDILKDYIENITTNFSDSDVEVTLRKGMFLARYDLSACTSDRLSPEVYETDSLSESLLLTKARKKRRKYKRHSLEDLDLALSVSSRQKLLIQKCLKQQYSKYVLLVTFDLMCVGCNFNRLENLLEAHFNHISLMNITFVPKFMIVACSYLEIDLCKTYIETSL